MTKGLKYGNYYFKIAPQPHLQSNCLVFYEYDQVTAYAAKYVFNDRVFRPFHLLKNHKFKQTTKKYFLKFY